MKKLLLVLTLILSIVLAGCNNDTINKEPETLEVASRYENKDKILDVEKKLLEKSYIGMTANEQVHFTVIKLKIEDGVILDEKSEEDYKRLLKEEEEYIASLPSRKENSEGEKDIAEEPSDRKLELEKIIKSRVNDGEYKNVTLDNITINEDLGTDAVDDYIALVYFKFDIRNKIETGNKLMRMYSDDLVATLANKGISDISEAAIFWEDNHNSRSLKYAYEYKDNGFYITDIMGE